MSETSSSKRAAGIAHRGDSGEYWLAQRLPVDWFWQPPKRDFGKDGIVVIRDKSDLHNLEFALQVKASAALRSHGGKISLSGITRTAIEYWFASPIPTLIVLIDLSSDRGWFAWNSELINKSQFDQNGPTKSLTIRVPEANQLDARGWERVRYHLRRHYAGLGRALDIAERSSQLGPAVHSIVDAVRHLAAVVNISPAAPGSHPDTEPVLAIHEQVQHRNILNAARTVLSYLDRNAPATHQMAGWIDSYEATALLAYPNLRGLPEGDEIGPEFTVMVTSEIVPEVRARLMVAALDLAHALMAGKASRSPAVGAV